MKLFIHTGLSHARFCQHNNRCGTQQPSTSQWDGVQSQLMRNGLLGYGSIYQHNVPSLRVDIQNYNTALALLFATFVPDRLAICQCIRFPLTIVLS